LYIIINYSNKNRKCLYNFNSFMFFVFIIIFIKLLIGKWTNVKNSLGNLFVNYKGNIKEII